MTGNKIIIGFTRKKAIGAVVSVGSKKVKRSMELGWTMETLDIVFKKLVTDLKAKKIRILISSDLSYVVRLTIPSSMDENEQRSYVKGKISETIPETLGKNDWDFKEINLGDGEKDDGDTKEIIAISMVSDFYKILSKAVTHSKVEVEAIEPEDIAKTRNKNPIVGLALKKDINGPDAKVLNLEVKKEEPEKPENNEISESKPRKLPALLKYFIYLLLVSFSASVLFYGYYVIYQGNEFPFELSIGIKRTSDVTNESRTNLGDVEPTLIPTLEPTATGTPSISVYKIVVQNGSGEEGAAENVQQILLGIGLSEIEVENADNFDYIDTIVARKQSVPNEVFDSITSSLSANYTVQIGNQLDDDNVYDIQIIVGQKKI